MSNFLYSMCFKSNKIFNKLDEFHDDINITRIINKIKIFNLDIIII